MLTTRRRAKKTSERLCLERFASHIQHVPLFNLLWQGRRACTSGAFDHYQGCKSSQLTYSKSYKNIRLIRSLSWVRCKVCHTTASQGNLMRGPPGRMYLHCLPCLHLLDGDSLDLLPYVLEKVLAENVGMSQIAA